MMRLGIILIAMVVLLRGAFSAKIINTKSTDHSNSKSNDYLQEAIKHSMSQEVRNNIDNNKELLGKTLYSGNQHSPDTIFVVLHGFGDSATNLKSLAEMLLVPQFPSVLFVFPDAVKRRITAYKDQKNSLQKAWYDVKTFHTTDENVPQDGQGIYDSSQKVLHVVGQCMKKYKVQHSRIVVGGFSQGAVVSLMAGLTSKTPLAGLVLLSGYFGGDEHLVALRREDPTIPLNIHTPMLICHGQRDTVIPYKYALRTRERLEELGASRIKFRHFSDLGHTTDITELIEVGKWLRRLLNLKEPEEEVGGTKFHGFHKANSRHQHRHHKRDADDEF